MLLRFIFLLLLLPAFLGGATRNELRVYSNFLGAIDTLSNRIDTTIVNTFLTYAQYRVSADMKCIDKVDTISLSTDSNIYDLPTDMVKDGVKSVFLRDIANRKTEALTFKSRQDFGKDAEGGLNNYTYFESRLYLSAVDASGDTLFVHYAKLARELTEDTMVSDIPDEYADMVAMLTVKSIYWNLRKFDIARSIEEDYQYILNLRLRLYEFKATESKYSTPAGGGQ